jgi:hypothetical protein
VGYDISPQESLNSDGQQFYQYQQNEQSTLNHNHLTLKRRGCLGRDRMVVGFTTTYAISAYQH